MVHGVARNFAPEVGPHQRCRTVWLYDYTITRSGVAALSSDVLVLISHTGAEVDVDLWSLCFNRLWIATPFAFLQTCWQMSQMAITLKLQLIQTLQKRSIPLLNNELWDYCSIIYKTGKNCHNNLSTGYILISMKNC
jgi:hypothetical protein